MAKTTIGILYDFDKTLCTTDMQEYDFIKKKVGYLNAYVTEFLESVKDQLTVEFLTKSHYEE